MVKFNSKTLLVILLVTLIPFSSVISASFSTPVAAGAATRTKTGFSDDFTTTDALDSGNTTAVGWGSGTVTSPRTSLLQLLDYFATTNSVRSVDVQGRKAYVGIYRDFGNPHVQIFDLTDPSNLNSLTYRNAPTRTSDVLVDGDILYVGSDLSLDGDGDLFTYNVSDTSVTEIPSPLDNIYDIPGIITGLAKQGHFLYLAAADPSGAFQIYDVEDPANVILANTWGWDTPLDFDVHGQVLYAAHSTYGVKTINVSAPYSVPQTIMDSVNTPGNATSILVDGGVAYVADGSSGVQVVDVSNPNDISIIGSYDTPGNALKLALQGDTLFVADYNGGVQVLDVSDPANPTSLTSVSPANVSDVALYGSVLVVGASDGIYTYQYGSFTDLSVVGSYSNYDAWDVRVRGDVAYVAAGSDGLVTLNVSNPAAPVLLDQYTTGSGDFYRKLDVQGHLAFVNNYSSSGDIMIFDVSDPTDITLVNSDSGTELLDLFAWGELLFYTYSGGFGIANISTPSSPIYYPDYIGANVTACWVQGYHLYLACNLSGDGYGIRVYDITDALNPVLVDDDLWLSSNHYDIFVDGDVAYAANNFWEGVYNVTNPFEVAISDSIYNPPSRCLGVWGFGPYMISARYGEGISIFDTSDITDSRLISSNTGISTAIQVTVHGDYIYVANRNSLEILHFFDSSSSFVTGVSTAQSITVDTTLDLITNATIDATTLIPYSTGMSYYLSADGGLNWESVYLGVPHTFTNPGSDLRFRVNLTTSLSDRSALLFDITIDYDHISLVPPFPLAAVIAVIVIIIVILIILLLYFFWYKKKEK